MAIDEDMKFSQNLKSYLKEKNFSLKEFSNAIGVPTSTAHGWLNGIPPRNVSILNKVAKLIGCSIDELCFSKAVKKHETNIVITIGGESFALILKKLNQ